MDELFRQSGLIRPKWDEQHFADGATYGERTIERAVRNTSEFYEPSGGEESDHVDTADQPEQASTIDTANDSAETTQTDDDRSGGRERAYLKEQNKVLTAKLEERETTIEQQQERIEMFEAELAALRSASRSDGSNSEHASAHHPPTSGETDESSMWDRVKRFVE